MKKYQLKVYWKNGAASGRVIELAWPLSQDLKNIKRVVLAPYKSVAPAPAEDAR